MKNDRLVYLRARYYDSVIGAFISEDPAKDGLNWYVYCGSDPVNYWDPTGHVKEGDKELYGENSVKYKMLVALGNAWNKATTNDDRNAIENMADKLRAFDDNSLNRVMLLNNSNAAQGAGHNGNLQLNSLGEGLFFSYYPQNGKGIDNGEMRFAVLSSGEVNEFLYGNGRINGAVSSSGVIRYEEYDRYIYNAVSGGQCYNMYYKAVEIFDAPGMYALIGHQCDNVIQDIMNAGNRGTDWNLTPNASFGTHSQVYKTPAYYIHEKRNYIYTSLGVEMYWIPCD